MTTMTAVPPPPEVGDFAPNFQLPDEKGKPFILRADQVAGRPVLLAFAPAAPDAAMFATLRAAAGELKDAGAVALLVRDAPPPENAALLEQHGLACRAISDPGGKLRQAYGIEGAHGTMFVLLSPNQRLQAVEPELAPVLERMRRDAARREEVAARPHPPVLVVPEALSRAECRRLIDLCESPGWPTRSVADHLKEKGNYKIEINDYGRVDRVDFVLQDPDTLRWLDQRIHRRVLPEILKAFQYRVARRERFHIARYEGARGGFQHGHRDNPTPELAHRRFALSLNLNTEEYEGGALRFPEYGAQRYRAETGAALVFSSSLLHEVLEVTSGRRYVLLSHFYGADGQTGRPTQPA